MANETPESPKRLAAGPRRSASPWILPLLLVALCGALPASADWLVPRDGDPLATEGRWRVEGERVIFHLPGGTLASLPLSAVDLDASRELTAARERPEPPMEPPARIERQAKVVLTDSDVRRIRPLPEADEAAEEEGAASAAASGSNTLEVTGWDHELTSEPPGLALTGTLRNRGESMEASITLEVTLVARDGEGRSTAVATLDRKTLPPGVSSRFRAVLPDVFDFGTVEFRARSTALEVRRPPAEPPGEGSSG